MAAIPRTDHGRYRIPAVPFLVVFAAVAVEGGLTALAARRWPAGASLGAGVVVAGDHQPRARWTTGLR